MTVRKSIVIAGKRIKLAHMRRSAKGAEVVGARVHIKGLGTVYVQVYERDESTPPVTHPSPPRAAVVKPERQANAIDAMMIETMRAMTERLAKLESRAVILPEGTKIPDPRPTDGHMRR